MDEDRDPAGEKPARPMPPAVDPSGPTVPKPGAEAAGDLLSIEEFQRWDLRVARILSAEPHPRADRLLKLRVDLGGEERPLVAGIAAQYRPEELVGRLIVVVANLKPARLRGEESRGMLLAASSGEVVSLLAPDCALPPGARVR
jgi:methionyl-tRNA synthetase